MPLPLLSTQDLDILLSNAMQYYRAHAQCPDISLRKVALLFGINHSTLLNRLHNKSQSRSRNGGQNKLLNAVQEIAVMWYLTGLSDAGVQVTEKMIANAVVLVRVKGDGVQEPPPSKTRVRYFVKKNPEVRAIMAGSMGGDRQLGQDISVRDAN
jgi:hypothetical protein